jgi:serine/threonine protein kinase, bacterial
MQSCKSKLIEHLKFIDDAYCAQASPNEKDPVQRISGSDLQQPPVSPTATPSKTLTTTPSPTKPSPEQAIRDYYSLINDRKYKTAWQNLTPKFQQGRVGGYTTFTDWWRTIDQVQINDARLIESKENSAIIDIDMVLQKGKAPFPETLRMYLVWNESSKQWQINETKGQ